MKVVSNASPLINLARIGQLALLPASLVAYSSLKQCGKKSWLVGKVSQVQRDPSGRLD
ncbi:MAG: hypothetical protein IPF56_21500 [Chloroflexi bacterium]|nr:hypothetical protein [Chloroflexota bacterium]